ncbi:MAG: bifunctional 5,10-methylene-tetrahydrofolate dehydrogenase/5,10-methylene-tetrahydrofolate cyclohydrolase [Verrucomicrobiae bacterium]|nr:bifunctional 5,10-methylene-tetrahydrofolate dehydrogenase/5,10-methylene-tetrahydrofolate cyclohydrolase [Verrucomicrobiae bacterium]
MPAEIIDGTAIAEEVHAQTAARVAALRARGIQPAVTFIRVGEDPASRAYVSRKHKKAEELGILSDTIVLDEKTTEAELLALIARLNGDPAIHGILIQAPVPSHIREQTVFAAVSPKKDVDGFHPVNAGKLLLGDESGFRPCTPAGVHHLLIRAGIKTQGAEVAIVGRGNIVGKPMAAILLQKAPHCDATVTLLHSRSRDIAAHTRRADIIIAALGKPHFVTADMVKPGACVIDVGVNRVPDPSSPRGYRLTGDVDFEAVRAVAGMITPNPGGVGPMTIAMLMSNTARAAEIAAR